MGFNISGLAINKNCQIEFDQLQKELGWNFEKKNEIEFEKASSNYKEKGICDVYFLEKGTLIFINVDDPFDYWSLEKSNTLTFGIYEGPMNFVMHYCEKGIKKRGFLEFDGRRDKDEEFGEKLEVEKQSEDTSEIIWNQIEKVIGKRFWDIEPEEKAVRYVFSKAKVQETKTKIEVETSEVKKDIALDSKKWWQFWK